MPVLPKKASTRCTENFLNTYRMNIIKATILIPIMVMAPS
jgi:hypothetical protein